jgi:hypothetical protein
VFDLFPRNQVLVIKYEEFCQNPYRVADSMFDFLDVRRVRALKNKRRNVGSYSRKVRAEEREYLSSLFEEDISKLEALLDWDCSNWRFAASVPATYA